MPTDPFPKDYGLAFSQWEKFRWAFAPEGVKATWADEHARHGVLPLPEPNRIHMNPSAWKWLDG